MIEFIGLRPKLYIYKMHEGKEHQHQHFKVSFHWKPTNESEECDLKP